MRKKYLMVTDFLDLQRRKNEIITRNSSPVAIPNEQIWLDNMEFMELLRISRKTTQNYRDRNLIGFTTIGANADGHGGRVFYKFSDVLAFLEENYKPIDRP